MGYDMYALHAVFMLSGTDIKLSHWVNYEMNETNKIANLILPTR